VRRRLALRTHRLYGKSGIVLLEYDVVGAAAPRRA
jgi:hypothetical protein